MSLRIFRNLMIVALVLMLTAWLAWRIKSTADNTFTIAGHYPVERVDMSPSTCIIHPVNGTKLGSIFNFDVFSGLTPVGISKEGGDIQRLPSLEKYGATFNAYSTRYGRLEVGTTEGELANGSSYLASLLYLYPHTSDLSQFLPPAVLNQLPPITDRQIGIRNAKGDAEIIIEIKAGQITFVLWCWRLD